MYNYGLLLVLLDLSLDVVGSVSQVDIDRHLELGREFLSNGQLKDALSQYHAAVDGDPSNYLTYYKRGTVYLALSKAKFALLDLDKVLELKPDFTAARLERGKILLKQAQFDAAETDFSDVLSVEPNNEEAGNSLNRISSIKQEMQLIDHFIKSGDHALAIDRISQIIDLCPWAPELRDLRAESRIALGDYRKAISDIRSTTILLSDNTQGLLKLSKLHYQLGEVEQALDGMRKCLKLDPEHKECLKIYRKLRQISKLLAEAEAAEDARNYTKCVSSAESVLTREPSTQDVRFIALQLLCKCYVGNDDPIEALKSCQEALKINRNPVILCDSAEAYLAAEEYDDAIRDYMDALEIDPSLQRAKEGLQKAQKRQKLSESRDYYKILGVPRTATKRDIIKAYRKAAQKWHPDNFQEGVKKKRAENMFIDIAAAKEVLTDDEKRARFDQGEDPLDPESGKYQHHRSNPFQEFHHFHGSPFQFKFHFN